MRRTRRDGTGKNKSGRALHHACLMPARRRGFDDGPLSPGRKKGAQWKTERGRKNGAALFRFSDPESLERTRRFPPFDSAFPDERRTRDPISVRRPLKKWRAPSIAAAIDGREWAPGAVALGSESSISSPVSRLPRVEPSKSGEWKRNVKRFEIRAPARHDARARN